MMNSDAMLRADIEAELEFEPSLDATAIAVALADGVATLAGHVASYGEKLAAERAASRVKGVRAVVEAIEVRLPSHRQHDDAEIARRAANLLAWGVDLPSNVVHITVEKGWVTLTGDVDRQYEKQSAEHAIRSLGGVIAVSNLIKLRPHPTVGDVGERIAEAYRRNAELESSGIDISVEGGTVTLSGRVKAWHERRTAENAAWAIPGVSEVVDNLVVA